MRKWYCGYVILLGIMVILAFFDIVDFSVIDQRHFDVITINSIFAGFLFSSLSLILGLGKNNTIVRLERMDAMNTIYRCITSGIVCSAVSISCAVINIFTHNDYKSVFNVVEAYFMLMVIINFLLSVRYVKLIIRMIRGEIKRELPSKEIIQHALDKIK